MELISSPCTPLVNTTRLPGFAPLATVTDTYQCCPVGACTPLKEQEMLLSGLQVVDIERTDDLLSLDHFAGVDRPRSRNGSRAGSGRN